MLENSERVIVKSQSDFIFGKLAKLSNKKSANLFDNFSKIHSCYAHDDHLYQVIGEEPEVVGKIMKHHEFLTMVKEKENEWRTRTHTNNRKKHTSLSFEPNPNRKLMSKILEEEDFDMLALYFMEDEFQSDDIQVDVCGKEITVSLDSVVVEKISMHALNKLSLSNIPKYLERVRRDIEDIKRMK